MLTCCPHCHATFRITSDQIKVRRGQVRCGACQEVFNALESLADEVPLPEPASAVVETLVATPDPAIEEVTDTDPPVDPAEDSPVDPPTDLAAAPESPAVPESPPESPLPVDTGTLAEDPPPPESSPPEEWESVPDIPPPRRWPWALGAVFLCLFAGLQAVYFYRIELAAQRPEWRTALAAACTITGCIIPLPRQPKRLVIETSDLAPAGKQLLLTATLRNRASFVQEYPHLELTLTDVRDAALARKVLAPADYLPSDINRHAGFPADADLPIRLGVDIDDLPAVGYRLYLFYP